MRRRNWLTSAAVVILTITVSGLLPPKVAAAPADDGAAALGPGCATDRPAIAHHPGGVVVEARTPAPVPCYTRTGWRTSEIALVVTNNGDLVFQPAFDATGVPIGAIRSTDQGVTWEFVQPANPDDPPRTTGFDQNMSIDRRTGRVFWITPGYIPIVVPAISRLDASDDDGKTFFRASIAPLGEPNRATGQVSRDHPQVFVGPDRRACGTRCGAIPRSCMSANRMHPNSAAAP